MLLAGALGTSTGTLTLMAYPTCATQIMPLATASVEQVDKVYVNPSKKGKTKPSTQAEEVWDRGLAPPTIYLHQQHRHKQAPLGVGD